MSLGKYSMVAPSGAVGLRGADVSSSRPRSTRAYPFKAWPTVKRSQEKCDKTPRAWSCADLFPARVNHSGPHQDYHGQAPDRHVIGLATAHCRWTYEIALAQDRLL